MADKLSNDILEKLLKESTPGEWCAGLGRLGQPDKRKVWRESLQVASAESCWIALEMQEANADLIALAPTLARELLELRKQNELLRQEVRDFRAEVDPNEAQRSRNADKFGREGY